MDRLLLLISTGCFFLGFLYSAHALVFTRVYRASPWNFLSILAGFALQTGFLYLRGERVGRCPLTSHFEVLIFIAWSMVLIYLLVGPTYRISLLGAFTAPLAFMFHVGAITFARDVPSISQTPPNGWMELHAAISIVAYGAFALAGVAGLMYLTQERQLKTHHLHASFYQLPPIRDLAIANARLILTGFALLTVGIGAGLMIGNLSSHGVKITWSIGVWLLYGLIFALNKGRRLSPRRVAWLSILAFTAVLLTVSGIRFLAETPHPAVATPKI